MSLLLPFRLRSGSADGQGPRALVVAATAGASPWPFGAFTTRQQGAPWWALLLSGLGLGTAVALLLRLLSWWRTWVGVPRFIMFYWDYELENCKLDTAGFAWHKSIHSTYAYMSTSFSTSFTQRTLHLYIHLTRQATIYPIPQFSRGIIPSFKPYASCVCREKRYRWIRPKVLLQVLHAWRSW